MADRFRCLVVGKGLIGSAAARHLAGEVDGVCLVGPDEPPARAEHHDVFGAHYDEGRIYRVLDPNPIWATLAKRSIERYAAIEAESGIRFHSEAGFLAVSPAETGRAELYAQVGADLGAASELLRGDALAARFPYLAFGPGRAGAYEPRGAGHISPRRLVDAQTAAAEHRGPTIVRESVHRLAPSGDGVEATTASGRRLWAERALVATGAFANVHAVLPRPLDLPVGGRTIVLVEVSEQAAPALRGMPSLVVTGSAPVADVYVLPPIRYPNGGVYVKLGTGDFKHPLTTPEALMAWFRTHGADEDRQLLHETLVAMIPALEGAPCHSDSCAIETTPSDYPYVDAVDDAGRMVVAVGGNGRAAKSSDEIGRLGARRLLDGDWTDDLPAAAFRVQVAV
jgi:glycine/D-amino acid oxidase-like deaminating enzyme